MPPFIGSHFGSRKGTVKSGVLIGLWSKQDEWEAGDGVTHEEKE